MTKLKVWVDAPKERTVEAFAAFLEKIPELGSGYVASMTFGQLRAMRSQFWDRFDAATSAGVEMFTFKPAAEAFESLGQPRDERGRWTSGGGGGGGTDDASGSGGGGSPRESSMEDLGRMDQIDLDKWLDSSRDQIKGAIEQSIGPGYVYRGLSDTRFEIFTPSTPGKDPRLMLRPLVTAVRTVRPNAYPTRTSWDLNANKGAITFDEP